MCLFSRSYATIYADDVMSLELALATPIDWGSVESRLDKKRDEVKEWLDEVGL